MRDTAHCLSRRKQEEQKQVCLSSYNIFKWLFIFSFQHFFFPFPESPHNLLFILITHQPLSCLPSSASPPSLPQLPLLGEAVAKLCTAGWWDRSTCMARNPERLIGKSSFFPPASLPHSISFLTVYLSSCFNFPNLPSHPSHLPTLLTSHLPLIHLLAHSTTWWQLAAGAPLTLLSLLGHQPPSLLTCPPDSPPLRSSHSSCPTHSSTTHLPVCLPSQW